MRVQENISLKEYNTFGVDLIARYFVEIENNDDYDRLLSFPGFAKIQKLILGGGSNVLFTADYNGLVIRINTRGIDVYQENENNVFLKVAAGEEWDDLVKFCVENNYGGLENLSMIPGKVGASPIQNIGAYGTEMEEYFVKLDCIKMETGERLCIDKPDCYFGYRDSIFKNELKGKCLITDVYFMLEKYPMINLTYDALQKELSDKSVLDLNISDISEAVRAIRSRKLPDPSDLGNAGSFFKNPQVDAEKFRSLMNDHPGIVGYTQHDGTVKLAAGWLIDQCGLKGYRQGDVGVHEKQALVLVNYGNASGGEIVDFSETIINKVFDSYGVRLEREVSVIT